MTSTTVSNVARARLEQKIKAEAQRAATLQNTASKPRRLPPDVALKSDDNTAAAIKLPGNLHELLSGPAFDALKSIISTVTQPGATEPEAAKFTSTPGVAVGEESLLEEGEIDDESDEGDAEHDVSKKLTSSPEEEVPSGSKRKKRSKHKKTKKRSRRRERSGTANSAVAPDDDDVMTRSKSHGSDVTPKKESVEVLDLTSTPERSDRESTSPLKMTPFSLVTSSEEPPSSMAMSPHKPTPVAPPSAPQMILAPFASAYTSPLSGLTSGLPPVTSSIAGASVSLTSALAGVSIPAGVHQALQSVQQAGFSSVPPPTSQQQQLHAMPHFPSHPLEGPPTRTNVPPPMMPLQRPPVPPGGLNFHAMDQFQSMRPPPRFPVDGPPPSRFPSSDITYDGRDTRFPPQMRPWQPRQDVRPPMQPNMVSFLHFFLDSLPLNFVNMQNTCKCCIFNEFWDIVVI